LSVQHPPATTLSVQHLPALPPSPNFGSGGSLPSTTTSVDFHRPGPATELPSQSRRSSVVLGDIPLSSPPLLSEAHPRIFPGTPELVGRYERNIVVWVLWLCFDPRTYSTVIDPTSQPSSLSPH
jgi:hypothetical protein